MKYKITIEQHIKNAITKGLVMGYSVDKVRDRIIEIVLERIKDNEKLHQIALADAQIVGFKHRQDGGDLITLIETMGLTESEWKKLKKYKHLSLNRSEKIMITKSFRKNGKYNA